MSIDISVIIVSWNAKHFVLDCLKSLQQPLEGGLTMETIVVDNASSDGTAEAIREFFPQVNLIESKTNLGFARGNNLGLESATGRYVCLVNPDVVVLAGCIERMLQYMEQKPDIGMLGPMILGSDRKVQRSCMRTPTLWNQFSYAVGLDTIFRKSRLFGGFLMRDFGFDQLRDVDIINGCFWLVRREALHNVGNLDRRLWMYADDLDWCGRFRSAGWRVVFFPDAKAIHYGGGTTEKAPVFFYVELQRSFLQYWRKHHSLASYFCYWLITYLAHSIRAAAYALLYLVRRSRRLEVAAKARKHLVCVVWLLGLKSVEESRIR
jgi:GT2 family glycosyltransferase